MGQQPDDRTLLLLFAHPDDETFGSGGTMARYAARGYRVVLLCATRGEEGEISDPSLASPEQLGEVRERELRCAARALGVSELIFLNYRDSGMAGTEQNRASDAFAAQPASEVVPRLVELIRRYRPEVVVTFDPTGGYGHPDHIAIHEHTVAAFHAAASPEMPERGEPWQASRLFYSVIPRSAMRELQRQMQELGVRDGIVEQVEAHDLGWPDEQIELIMDVSEYFDAKVEALHCHRTQFGDEHPFRKIPEETFRALMCREHYAIAWPQSPAGRLPDLFDGV